jgi:hypothetical protein
MVLNVGFEPTVEWILNPPRLPVSPIQQSLAEEVGFEPTEPFGPPVFKTGAISRSAILPCLVRDEGLEPPGACF